MARAVFNSRRANFGGGFATFGPDAGENFYGGTASVNTVPTIEAVNKLGPDDAVTLVDEGLALGADTAGVDGAGKVETSTGAQPVGTVGAVNSAEKSSIAVRINSNSGAQPVEG